MSDPTVQAQATTIDLLQSRIIEAMQGRSLAGYRIYAPRDWPTWDREYPVLLVLTPTENKDREGLGTILFNVRGTVRLVARVSATASEDDEGAIVALADLSTMQREIETSVIGNDKIAEIANIVAIRMTQGTRAVGSKHVGELVMDLDFTYTQGPEDFFVAPSVPMTSVKVVVDSGNVFDKTGTYAPPPLPYNVPAAPRTSGPDGRPEDVFEIDGLQT